jgi:hypothetical protein
MGTAHPTQIIAREIVPGQEWTLTVRGEQNRDVVASLVIPDESPRIGKPGPGENGCQTTLLRMSFTLGPGPGEAERGT